MKKLLKSLSALTLIFLLVLQLSTVALAAPTASGTCGPKAKWSYSGTTLTVSGKGAMYDYSNDDPPWMGLTIKKVVIKSGITSVSDYAFCGYQIKSISLPSTLKEIHCCAFSDNYLTSVTLPKNLKTVEVQAFSANPFKAYKVAKGNKYLSVKDGVLFNKKKTTLIAYPDGKTNKSYTIPSTVKTINAYVFSSDEAAINGNHYLQKLTVPKSVTTIKGSAFEYTSVNDIYFKGKAPKFGKDVFFYDIITIHYPSKYRSSWKNVPKSLKYTVPLSPEDDEFMKLTWKSWKG